MKIAGFVVVCALVLCFAPSAQVSAQTAAQAEGVDFWDDPPQGVGSIEQYNRDDWDSADREFQIPLIGINVRNAIGKLASGQPLRGLGVIAVKGGSAADLAGIHGERAALRSTLVGVFFAGSMIFPPAMLGAVLVEESGIGDTRDLIIAVDGARTRDVMEFENAMTRADAGEIVYLTVLRDGRRRQLQVKVDADALPRN